jgi:hypothetical protein
MSDMLEGDRPAVRWPEDVGLRIALYPYESDGADAIIEILDERQERAARGDLDPDWDLIEGGRIGSRCTWTRPASSSPR